MHIKLTEMEIAVLSAIDNSEYGSYLSDPVWTFSLEYAVPKKSLGGVLGSLSKKGLIFVDDEGEAGGAHAAMTPLGIDVYVNQLNSTVTKLL